MRLALFSDIHANPYALRAVLDDISKTGADQWLFLGDLFGYYPWAVETWDLFQRLEVLSILGNHDQGVLDHAAGKPTPDPAPEYDQVTAAHAKCLPSEALDWLKRLPLSRTLPLGAWMLHATHGTPADPLMGRYYPDDAGHPNWLPKQGAIQVLGHTHYPIAKQCTEGGWILNPGSVGQPRDGDPRPSWMLLELRNDGSLATELRRVDYDRASLMQRLRDSHWPARFIAALDKRAPGALKV